MSTEELCKWLREPPKLEVRELELATKVIEEQYIKGSNFLNYSKADWKADGLPGGVADSLVQIAQAFLLKSHTTGLVEVLESPWKRARPNVSLDRLQVLPKSIAHYHGVGSFIDVSGLHCAGLAAEDQDTKRLFMRSSSALLLERLRTSNDYRALRVFGPPGIGKSCIVWAWACDEHVSGKKVLWVHLTKDFPPSHILMNENGIFEVIHADEDYVEYSQVDIVIVDGVVGNLDSHMRYMRSLLCWKVNPHRKSIQVASMQVRVNDEDDEYKHTLRFTMAPWTIEEYLAACRNDEFFQQVKWAFKDLQAENIDDLITQKFYFAGSSARWMFNCSLAQVKLKIGRHIDACPNSIDLLKGIVGQTSIASVNHLWVGYPFEHERFRKFFVSKYAARCVLFSGGLEAVKLAYGVARGLNNPTFTGWVVEMDFILQLHHSIKGQVPIHYFSANRESVDDKWDVPGVLDFDFNCIYSVRETISRGEINFDLTSIKAVKDLILNEYWLVPMKWNQGGYDVVRLVKLSNQYLVSFIQITAAHQHSLKLRYFQDFASSIAFALEIEIPRIQIIMLVPDQRTANEFSIPATKVTHPGFLKIWKCTQSEDMWIQGQEHDLIQVMWFDSQQ